MKFALRPPWVGGLGPHPAQLDEDDMDAAPAEDDDGEDFLLKDDGNDLDLRCAAWIYRAWGFPYSVRFLLKCLAALQVQRNCHPPARRCLAHRTSLSLPARSWPPLCSLARLEYLMERRPELLSSVMLRQNPHNVHEWHKRAKLFQVRFVESACATRLSRAAGAAHCGGRQRQRRRGW